MTKTKARIYFRNRLLFTTIRTPDGAPLVDECWSNNEYGDFAGWCFRHGDRSLVVAVRGLRRTGYYRAFKARVRTWWSRAILRQRVTHIAVRRDHAALSSPSNGADE